MKKILALLGLVSLFSLTSCNSITGVQINGEAILKERNVAVYVNKVEGENLNFGKDSKIIYHYSEEKKCVQLSYKSGLDDYDFKYEVVDDTLKISTSSTEQFLNANVTITIYGIFKEFNINGNLNFEYNASSSQSANVSLNGSINSTFYDLSEKGNYTININGTSNIYSKGQCDTINLTINGRSKANLKELVASNANIITNGSSEVSISVLNNLSYDLKDSSHLSYYGSPTINKIGQNGLASIRKEYSKIYTEYLKDKEN